MKIVIKFSKKVVCQMQKNIITEKQAKIIARKIHEQIFTYCNQHSDRFEEFKNKKLKKGGEK